MPTSKKRLGPSRRLVTSIHNSGCSSAGLHKLDFSQWFSDMTLTYGGLKYGSLYLHVLHKDGETWHRVYPRMPRTNRWSGIRLECRKGSLFWLLDPC